MSEVLTKAEILEAVKEICASNEKVYLAVAYWGGGAAELLHGLVGDKMRVVLDVNAGGTDPRELQFLMKKLGKRVRVHADLHTKIYARKRDAIIGSANATRPGLQLKDTTRVEAAIRLQGKFAHPIHDFAKALYQQATPATDEHLRICRDRYGRKPLSESEFGPIRRMGLLDALEQQPSLYAHLPLIVSTSEVTAEERNRNWINQRVELGEGDDANFDIQRWDYFDWLLPFYDRKLCLALHNGQGRNGQGGAVYAGLMRPIRIEGREGIFALRANWNEVQGLTYEGVGGRRLPSGNQRDKLRQAIEKLADADQSELYVENLLATLGWR